MALGIVEIANNAMVGALRRISVQRGHDPRDFVLVAFGGAGPVHANRLAAELDVPTVLVPMGPGTTSAMGLLVTDVKHDYSATLIQRADRLDVALVNRRYREMEEQGEEALLFEGMGHAGIAFERQVDMRYVGQSYELSIPFGDGKVEDGLDAMLEVDDGFTHGPAVRAGVLDGDERGGRGSSSGGPPGWGGCVTGGAYRTKAARPGSRPRTGAGCAGRGVPALRRDRASSGEP